MAVAYNPSIVTNGLVLALDAANSKSYDSNENLLTYSEQFDNAAWSKVSTTVSANATAAPNGTLTADNVTNTPNSLSYLAQVKSGLSATTTYTASVYVKPLTTNKVVAFEWGGAWRSFNLSNLTDTGGGGTGQITVLDNGWYRISHTVTNVTSFNVIYIGAYGTTADTVTVALWGAQLEIGSSASPYYATTASAKNRGTTLIDLSGNGNNGTLINGATYSSVNGGVIVLDGTNDYIDVPINLATSNYTVMGAARYVTVSGRIFSAKNNNWLMGHWGGTTQNYYAEGWVSSVSAGPGDTNWRIYAATGNYSVDSWSMYVNGQLNVGPNANGSAGPNGFAIGSVGGTSEFSNAHVSNLLVYNRVLTAAEIQQNFNATRGRFGI